MPESTVIIKKTVYINEKLRSAFYFNLFCIHELLYNGCTVFVDDVLGRVMLFYNLTNAQDLILDIYNKQNALNTVIFVRFFENFLNKEKKDY